MNPRQSISTKPLLTPAMEARGRDIIFATLGVDADRTAISRIYFAIHAMEPPSMIQPACETCLDGIPAPRHPRWITSLNAFIRAAITRRRAEAAGPPPDPD